MTEIIGSLADIAGSYDTLYCDLWGCLHNGQAPYPAAVDALLGFRKGGGAVVLLTNAPRPSDSVIRQLDRMGLPRDAWDVVASSGDAAEEAMNAGAVGRLVWHLGPEKDDSLFRSGMVERVDMAAADGIVCTGLFDEFEESPEDYRGRLMMAKQNRLTMLCANPDIVVDYGDRRIWCAGALAELYEGLGGTVLQVGKPHPPIYDLAARRLAIARPEAGNRILAVGDGIATDIAGAAVEGIDAIFVTGGLAADRFGPDVENPDPALLSEYLAAVPHRPRFAIGRLR
ncbi:MAG: TIGR01459 family HAD-type hydrolase [Gemmobacter sp.]